MRKMRSLNVHVLMIIKLNPCFFPIQYDPWQIRTEQPNGTLIYSGLTFDVLNLLAESLNFEWVNCNFTHFLAKTSERHFLVQHQISLHFKLAPFLRDSYEVIEPEDFQWGAVDENGTWSGMIGQVARRVCKSLKISCFTTTEMRMDSPWMSILNKKTKISGSGLCHCNCCDERRQTQSCGFHDIFLGRILGLCGETTQARISHTLHKSFSCEWRQFLHHRSCFWSTALDTEKNRFDSVIIRGARFR